MKGRIVSIDRSNGEAKLTVMVELPHIECPDFSVRKLGMEKTLEAIEKYEKSEEYKKQSESIEKFKRGISLGEVDITYYADGLLVIPANEIDA